MSFIIHPKTVGPKATHVAAATATADRTSQSQKKAREELRMLQRRIEGARLAVQILKEWWHEEMDTQSLARRHNMSENTLLRSVLATGMQGILLAKAAGMDEFIMYEAMAYNDLGNGLPMKAALDKAIAAEEQAKYDRDLIVYHSLGLRPAKYNR